STLSPYTTLFRSQLLHTVYGRTAAGHPFLCWLHQGAGKPFPEQRSAAPDPAVEPLGKSFLDDLHETGDVVHAALLPSDPILQSRIVVTEHLLNPFQACLHGRVRRGVKLPESAEDLGIGEPRSLRDI